jgi:NAD(P)-dependent dehydrogenase (short-subunit alcohol dehydrogenase family)
MMQKLRLKPLNEQVVVLMGASSGIGRETAKRFAARGAKVVVSARTDEGLASLIEEIAQQGGEATAFPADVTEYAQMEAVAERTVQRYGRIDTWAHVAGVALYGLFDELQPEEFKRVVDTDLTGMAYGAMAALPHLKRDGGAFIGVSSVLAARSAPLLSAYSAAKHGAAGLLESLRLEMRYEGAPVSVTNILPSAINTTFFNKARTKMGVKPMGMPPIYQPGIVADAILYAAEHPVRDIVVGGAGKAIVAMQRLSPRLLDWGMLPIGVKAQQTDEPKSADAPNNLFRPIEHYSHVEGDFGTQSMPFSVTGWLDFHPIARRAAFLGTAAGIIAIRRMRPGKKNRDSVTTDKAA